MVCRILFLIIYLVCVQAAHAQTAFSVGFNVPVYANHQFNTGQDETNSGLRSAMAVSGEFIKFATRIIAFRTGIEFPTTTATHFTHHGTAGFDSDMTRREMVVSE